MIYHLPKLWFDSQLEELVEHPMNLRLVLVNGCFDILHVGHVDYLETARTKGDLMLVLLNSDRSVRMLKGPGRPINSELWRARVLAALECVSAIFIFNEPTVAGWLSRIQPYVWCKSSPYTMDSLHPDEVAAAKEAGTKIEIIPVKFPISTTEILNKT